MQKRGSILDQEIDGIEDHQHFGRQRFGLRLACFAGNNGSDFIFLIA